MTRPPDADMTLPDLHALHISHALIFDLAMFQNMVASHSIKKLTLSGEKLVRSSFNNHPNTQQLGFEDAFHEELTASVPEYQYRCASTFVDATPKRMPRYQWRMW